MKIRYTKKQLRYNLIFGIVWMVLGITALFFDSGNIFNYGYLLAGLLYLGAYLYKSNKQYLTIENGILLKNSLFPKKIELDKITRFKKFAGDYILNTNTTELRINTELIEEKSFDQLNAVLERLNLETEKF